ncbi:unnamed protein product [Cuscuta campestris]|uniref:At1g61320/AtMIF1 LRR domain-containing protein n=1 Tax=Cuscuta campestris TaxID=132261 RepID=A0A484K293_9ASTE|nr:unnamed protein product [Cuscuta campestris]
MCDEERSANEEQRQPGFENVEIISLEDDVGNKRMKEMPIDRLSAFPDCLLIHILSFLGLKKAAITSLLGKRWKFLWTELPTLEFKFWDFSGEKTKANCDFVARVHKTLATRSGKSLEKLEVTFKYIECFASDVDSWLRVAVKLEVKHVVLSMDYNGDLYTLNKEMCSCSSLTSLSLDGCTIEPQRAISWPSLTSLEIYNVDLPQPVVENILSGCPALKSLYLIGCWGFTFLLIKSQNLCELMVHDPEEAGGFNFLHISAPFLKSLNIWFRPEKKMKLSQTSSLVSATFHFSDFGGPCSEAVVSNTKEIFENTQQVKELELGRDAMKALAVLLPNGWQLPKSTRRCLTISSFSNNAESISCIVALLESSPYLETLIIYCDDSYGKKKTWIPLAKGDLCCDMPYLKTVKLSDLADAKLEGEPLLTLAQIILKRAPALKEMTIEDHNIKGTSEFAKISQTLLTYPRSSPDAVIFFLPH